MTRLLRTAAWVSPTLAARGLETLFTATRRFDVPEREKEWMRGAAGATFESRGRRLVAWSWGADDAERGVLLVHGWEGRGSQMGAFVEPLRLSGHRVVTFDAPGHGASPGRRSSLVEMADAVADAVRSLGPFDAVVAHSAGAAATTVALAHFRPASAPDALVFVAPPADLGAYLKKVSRWLGLDDDVAAITRRRLEAKFRIDWEALRAEELARDMTHPLLIIHDEEDREIGLENGRRLRDAWPGARLMTTTGLGHRRILRDVSVIHAAVRFVGGGGDARPTHRQASHAVSSSASS